MGHFGLQGKGFSSHFLRNQRSRSALHLLLAGREGLLVALPTRNQRSRTTLHLPLASRLPRPLAPSLTSSPPPPARVASPSASRPLSHFFSSFVDRPLGGKMEADQGFKFGPYKIDSSEVFYSTALSFAMVNLRPVVSGHVLVCPRREVRRFADLTADETSDLWFAAKEVGGRLESYHKASSLTFTIQDGPQAGQTVPHVHIHILPRKLGDFKNNDEIYDAIDVKESQLKDKLDLEKEREDRTPEEMFREAEEYRALFS